MKAHHLEIMQIPHQLSLIAYYIATSRLLPNISHLMS
jgi:hypothetical protein